MYQNLFGYPQQRIFYPQQAYNHLQLIRQALEISLDNFQKYHLKPEESSNTNAQNIIGSSQALSVKKEESIKLLQSNVVEERNIVASVEDIKKQACKEEDPFFIKKHDFKLRQSNFDNSLPQKEQVNFVEQKEKNKGNKKLKRIHQIKRRSKNLQESANDVKKVKPHRIRPSYLSTAIMRCGFNKTEREIKLESLMSRKVSSWTADKMFGRRSRELAYLFS